MCSRGAYRHGGRRVKLENGPEPGRRERRRSRSIRSEMCALHSSFAADRARIFEADDSARGGSEPGQPCCENRNTHFTSKSAYPGACKLASREGLSHRKPRLSAQ